MRILHVISSLDPRAGGPPMVISRLAAAQAQLGHEVHVLCYGVKPDGGKDPNPEIDQKLNAIPNWSSVQQHRLEPPNRFEWYTAGTAAAALRRIVPKMDIVHVHGVWDPILRAAASAAREAGKPYVVAPHGMLDPWALSEKNFKKRVALKLGYGAMVHGASLMHALSRYEADCIAKFGYRGPIEVIPNGVFLDEIDPLPAKGSYLRENPALTGRRFICFLSRLHPVKGLDLLAAAFGLIAAKHPDVHLVVIGPDFGAKESFEAQVASLKLTDRVHLPGPMWGRERFKPIVDCACYCLPSEHEAFSVAICEAMACGAPVVITTNCNLPEAAENNAGVVINRTVPELAAALDRILSSPTDAAIMGKNARALVEERFTWQQVAAAAYDAYQIIYRGTQKSLAVVANVQTPYRLATHQRIARELKDLKLWSLYTHDVPDQAWDYHADQEINPVIFGPGENCVDADKPRAWCREFVKGGELAAFIRREHIDAVIVSGYNDPGRLRLIFSCWLRGIPVFLAGDSNIKGDNARGMRKLAKNIVLRSVLHVAHGVLPFGSNGAEYFASYGATRDRTWFFPAEPDYEIFSRSQPAYTAAVQKEYNLSPNRRRIVFCGRMAQAKRPDLALKAFIEIAHERPDWDLVMIGAGPMLSDLKKQVPKELSHRVIWTDFIADPRKVSALYHCCDTFVIASEFEPWAVVVDEACTAGLAMCVSDRVGAARELVRHLENGTTFKISDPHSIVPAMLLATDSAHIEEFKSNSLIVAEQWRSEGDPVRGVRAALGSAGIVLAQPLKARTPDQVHANVDSLV